MKIKELSELTEKDTTTKGKAKPAAIKSAFNVILAELEKDGVEKLSVSGLGRFVVKKLEKDGVVNKRIVFTPAKKK